MAAAAEELRRTRHVGLSEAVNELARAGLRSGAASRPFRQRTVGLGVAVDVSNIAEALDLLDDDTDRDDR